MTLQKWIEDRAIHGFPTFSVEDKVNNILYQYHDNVQSSKETLYQDFINFKDKPYGYEQQIASR